MTYFNEWDDYAAAWLRNLYPGAEVDQRSIVDVEPTDLVGYRRCHFFGGIGGWEYALELAGWPAEWECWTGSCPCQPLSCAGKRGGEKDERHLWPEFYRLISECRPAIVFGEQVASKGGLEWLDGVSLDLEELGYAVASSDLPAASQGAPHIRQRFFWVAVSQLGDTDQPRWDTWGKGSGERQEAQFTMPTNGSEVGRLADAGSWQLRGAGLGTVGGAESGMPGEAREQRIRADAGASGSALGRLGQLPRPGNGTPANRGSDSPREGEGRIGGAGGPGEVDGVAFSDVPQRGFGEQRLREERGNGDGAATIEERTPWSDSLLIPCRDNKLRRISVESGDEPLAYGIPSKKRDPRLGQLIAGLGQLGYGPVDALRIIREARANRVGRLRGYGNAIAPDVAAVFIRAVMECLP